MMKRISIMLALALVMTILASCVAAPIETEETIFYEDGSYLVITTVASGRMTTSVIEGSAEVMSQSNQSQERYNYNSLSHQAGLEDQQARIEKQESMEDLLGYFAAWIVRDGKRIRVDTNANGLPRYRSEIATKYCSYYSADDRLLWTMSLTGIFRENVIDRHCDVVSTNVTIHEQDSWYVIDEAEDKDIDDVFYTVRFGRKNLGVTIAEPSYTISLSRDEQGDFH